MSLHVMDARHYFHLTDAIAAANTAEALTSLSEVVSGTEMHPLERRALERALRSRAEALRIGDIVVPRPAAQRAD
jgi:hypothetical protein